MLSAPAFAKPPMNDSIIAIVNNEAITLKDLRQYIASIRSQLQIENKSRQEIEEIMGAYEEKGINQLIEDRLILEAAEEKGLIIRPEIVDKRLKDIKAKYASEDEFLKILNDQGITIGELKKKLTDQMKAKYTVDIEVREKIFVNPQDVTKYYNEHKADFIRRKKINLDSIYISFDKDKNLARARAAEARKKLLDGEDFEKISKEYSQAPSVGTIEQGQMVPAIEDAVFKLKLEEVSDLIEVEGGIYVFKVKGISPGKEQTLQEVKDQVYYELFDQQFQVKFKEWVEKLRSKAYVEIKQ
jgi:parvulin-like peptidyl-prolyl isomerase